MRQTVRILSATIVGLFLAATTFAQVGTQEKAGQQQNPQARQQQVNQRIGQQNKLITSDWLIGKTVYSPKAEELGSITNLIVNERTGQIGYAVVSTGGFFDLSDVKQIVPFQSLKLAPEQANNQVTLNMSKDQLARAPQWKQGLTVDQFDRQTAEFFGVSPAWGDNNGLINGGVLENNRGNGILENDRGGILQDKNQ